MTEHVERTRRSVLTLLPRRRKTTSSSSRKMPPAALKLVGESFPFAPGSRYLLTFDNHNSVNGIREFARARGAGVQYAPLAMPELRLDAARLEALLAQADPARANLFAFPAQSNFSGVRHPLEIVAQSAEQRMERPARCRRLRAHQPAGSDRGAAGLRDAFFLQDVRLSRQASARCSIRRSAFAKLRRPWFAGGTVNFASVQGRRTCCRRTKRRSRTAR